MHTTQLYHDIRDIAVFLYIHILKGNVLGTASKKGVSKNCTIRGRRSETEVLELQRDLYRGNRHSRRRATKFLWRHNEVLKKEEAAAASLKKEAVTNE